MSKLDPGDPRKDLALENQGGHSVQTMLGIRPQRRTGGRAYAAAGAVFAVALCVFGIHSFSGAQPRLQAKATAPAGPRIRSCLGAQRALLVARASGTADIEAQLNKYKKYCESVERTVRRPTRTVNIGPIKVGSEHPIAVQTMTTTNTFDVQASVDQVMQVADAGCDLVRLTVQGKKEAKACMKIKDELLKRGYDIPLVADIHFAPAVAMEVADAFDKIRINPGNFYDGRKKFEDLIYDDQSYNEELEKIEEVFTPLVEKCKRLGRAMRIGTNHGSLSARTLCFYGDTPKGMVESAMEFARICRKNDYHNFLFSMKASNPLVMNKAYRLLASEMYEQGWDYPLHLGVTEAGEGEDGRMKSAIGIGSLLMDGLGDTIRVSLTEDPHLEIHPCQTLANIATERYKKAPEKTPDFIETTRDWESFARRETELPAQRAEDKIDFRGLLHRDGSVLSVVTPDMLSTPDKLYTDLGCKMVLGLPFKDIATTDSILLTSVPPVDNTEAWTSIKRLQDGNVGILVQSEELKKNPVENSVEVRKLADISGESFDLVGGAKRFAVEIDGQETEEDFAKLSKLNPQPEMILYKPDREAVSWTHAGRRVFQLLQKADSKIPVILYFTTDGENEKETMVLKLGTDAGSLLVDGYGDGVAVGPDWRNPKASEFELSDLRTTSFAVLQGCRMRSTKTEFVSCPSCGRTLFDLQETTQAIAERTGHLPGVAIAVMGCIVNGPGEMADADFGYVGGAPGKVDLYVGKEVVKKGIPNAEACDALIELIKEHGRWVEPEPKEEEEKEEAVVSA
ncbi:hypothetical protein AAMO2058_000377600 [Amorphochlora amoebiformis]